MKHEDTLIVGAGPIGLACAISARRRGIDPLVIDAGAIVNSIVHYPIGMTFFTTPELLEIGAHPFVCSAEKPTREEALMYYRGVVRSEGLRVHTYTKLIATQIVEDGILCEFDVNYQRRHRSDRTAEVQPGSRGEVLVKHVILATGYYDNPNRLGVPGEDLPQVRHYFDEAHRCSGLRVVVIGGKNSAVEAALLLFRAGARTWLVYRGNQFSQSVKYWIKPDIENRIKEGEIVARLGSTVSRIEENGVVISAPGEVDETIPADRVYALTGYQPDIDLFRKLGIDIDPGSGVPAIDPATLQTNVPGIYMAGSIKAGYATSNVFIENGRFDGEKIFDSRAAAR